MADELRRQGVTYTCSSYGRHGIYQRHEDMDGGGGGRGRGREGRRETRRLISIRFFILPKKFP